MSRTVEAVLKLSAKLGSMAAFATVGRNLANVDRKAKALNKSQGLLMMGAARAGAAMAGYLAPAALVYGAQRAVRQYATLERQITRIGITAEASAADTRNALTALQDMATQYAMPMSQVAEGLDSLTASGRNMKDSMDFLPSVLAAAQASGAEVRDMATSADAMASSFGIAADQMGLAFDIVAKLGKEGKFELKDMAAELPSLAPAFAALGYKGTDALTKIAAAAQTVRMQTGSSAEAATALMNVFQKMESQATAANFAKFGVDLRKEMARARKEGRDLLDFYIEISRRAIKGDMSKLPQLFTDMQMLQGMRALIGGADAMERFRDAASEAAGTVNKDLNTVLSDTESKVQRLANSWENLWTQIGAGLVNLGADKLMDRAASVVPKAAADDRAFTKMGINGLWARNWWMLNATDQQRAGLAWMGGYRSPEDRAAVAGYGAYGAGRSAAPDMPVGTIPLPTPRPGYAPAGRGRRGSRAGRRGGAAFAGNEIQIREHQAEQPWRNVGGGLSSAVPFTEYGSSRMGDDVAQKLVRGGEEAGAKLGQGGEEAGAKITTAADDIRKAGEAAAAAIRSAASDMASRIASAVRGAASIRADVGRTGPSVEGGVP